MIFKLTTTMHETIVNGGQNANDRVDIINGEVILNGINLGKCNFELTIYNENTLPEIKLNQFNVNVSGDAGDIATTGKVTVGGNAGKVNTTGAVTVNGDVNGNVSTTGKVKANKINGKVNTSHW